MSGKDWPEIDELAALLEGAVWREDNPGLAERHRDHRYYAFCAICTGDTQEIARVILAAGYERRRDHVAEQDEIRKQVRG